MCRYFQHVGRVGKDVQARGVSGETREAWRGIFISSEESEQISAHAGPETHSLPHQDYFFLHIKLVSRSQHAVLFFFIIWFHTQGILKMSNTLKKKSSSVADRIRRKQLSLQTCSHACSGSMLWGGDLCRKKAPEDRRQSNTGALYLREHKSSPHVRNKESEGLSGRSETSRGLWENPTTVSFHHVVSWIFCGSSLFTSVFFRSGFRFMAVRCLCF